MVYTPKQGNYHLSTVGKYYVAHYANLSSIDKEEDIKAGSSEESSGDAVEETDEASDEASVQMDLGNSSNPPENESEESSETEQSTSISEAENTEEKAEVLFNDVSETRRTNE
jgi:hypothetical protein